MSLNGYDDDDGDGDDDDDDDGGRSKRKEEEEDEDKMKIKMKMEMEMRRENGGHAEVGPGSQRLGGCHHVFGPTGRGRRRGRWERKMKIR